MAKGGADSEIRNVYGLTCYEVRESVIVKEGRESERRCEAPSGVVGAVWEGSCPRSGAGWCTQGLWLTRRSYACAHAQGLGIKTPLTGGKK